VKNEHIEVLISYKNGILYEPMKIQYFPANENELKILIHFNPFEQNMD